MIKHHQTPTTDVSDVSDISDDDTSSPPPSESRSIGGSAGRLERIRAGVGLGWNRHRSLGLHLGDDAIRLAAVDVPGRRCVAVAERRIDLGDIVDGEIRRPDAVRQHLQTILTEFGLPRRRPLTVAVEADLDPVATQPPPGYTSTNVTTQTGRELGEAFIRTEVLRWITTTIGELAPRVRIEPVATSVLRCYADQVSTDGTTGIVHVSGGRRTRIVLDVAAYERARRPVSIEATTSADTASGVWVTATPGESGRVCTSMVELAPALADQVGERMHDFAPAIGAALSPTGALACDFRSGSVISMPTEECDTPGWVLQRI